MPICSRLSAVRALASRSETGVPSKAYVPSEGSSSIPRMWSSVLLPEPDGPTMVVNSPSRMVRSTWRSTHALRRPRE